MMAALQDAPTEPAMTMLPVLPALASTAAIGLAVVFVVAAAAKVQRPATADVAEFGLPIPRVIATVLPPIEFGVAALLLIRPRFGAVMALVLLLAFTTLIAEAVGNNRSVSCGCLGSLSRRPVGWPTLGRNVALLCMAAFAAATPTLVTPDLVSVLVLVGGATLIALGAQLLELRRTVGRVWSVELAGEEMRL